MGSAWRQHVLKKVVSKTILDTWITSTLKPTPEDISLSCPINVTFLHRLVAWGGQVEWESQQAGETSFLEITLDFIFTTGTYPPLPVPKFQGRGQTNKSWILIDQQIGPFDHTAFTIDQAVQGLSRTVNWIYKKHGILIFPHPTKHQTVPLKRFWVPGTSCRNTPKGKTQ